MPTSTTGRRIAYAVFKRTTFIVATITALSTGALAPHVVHGATPGDAAVAASTMNLDRVNLDRLFGPYEQAHPFSLRVESTPSVGPSNPWLGEQSAGYAAVSSPPSIPAVPFVKPNLPTARVAPPPAEVARSAFTPAQFGMLLVWLAVAVFSWLRIVVAYRGLLHWSARPNASVRFQRAMQAVAAIVNRCDAALRSLGRDIALVVRFMKDTVAHDAGAAWSIARRKSRRHLAVAWRSIRSVATHWRNSSWAERSRMVRRAAIHTFAAMRQSAILSIQGAIAVARRPQKTVRTAMVFAAMGMILFSPAANPAFAADEYWRTDGQTGGTWTSTFWNIGSPNATGGTGWTAGNNAIFTENSTLTFATSTVGNVTVADGKTVTITANQTLTLGGVRTFDIGTGATLTWTSQGQSTASGNEGAGIIKNGAGTLNWGAGPGTNVRYNGGFTLNAGTVIVSGDNALTSGALTLNGGTLQSTGGIAFTSTSITIGGDFALAGTGNTRWDAATTIALGSSTRTITNNTTSGSRQFRGLISGGSGAGLTFNGTGSAQVYIGNTGNTFTGSISLLGSGEVVFNGNGALGDSSNSITIDGGRLTMASMDTGGSASALTSATIASTHDIFVGDTVGTSISIQGGTGVTTYNGVIDDVSGKTGSWAKQGAGKLILGGVSTYTGTTSINNGTLQLADGDDRLPTGTVVNLGQAASGNLGTLDLNGKNQTIAGLVSIAGTNSSANDNTVTSASAAMLTLGGTGAYVYGAGTNANSGIITGSISVVKSGSGTQTLGDFNTYTGTTSVTGGKLYVNGSLAVGSAVTVSGTGVLGGNGNGTTTGKVSGTVTINSGGGITAGGSDNTAGKLTTGALTFNQGGNYNWYTTSDTGDPGVNWSQIVAPSLSLGDLTSLSKFNINLISLSGAGTLGNATFNAAVDHHWSILTSTAAITGFNANLFNIDISGFSNGLSGGTFSLSLGNSDKDLMLDFTAFTASNLIWSGGTGPGLDKWNLTDANFNGNAVVFTNGSDVIFDDTAVAAHGTVDVDAGGVLPGSVTVSNSSGTYTFNGGAIGGNGALTKTGDGTLLLNNQNTYDGGTFVNGGIVRLGANSALLSGGNVSVANAAGAVLDVNGKTQTIGTLTGGGTTGGTVSLGNSGALTLGTADNFQFDGSITGDGSLTKVGTGTFTLGRAASDYTGATNINAGTIKLNVNGAMSSASAVILADVSTATLDLNGKTQTLASLAGGGSTGGNVALGAGGVLTVGDGSNTTFSGTISGTGAAALVKQGGGMLTLSSASGNTYAGGTTINNGTLRIGNDNQLGNASGALALNGGTLSITAGVASNRALTVGTTGTIATGGNNFANAGTTTINGTLSTTGSGNVALNGTTTFGASGALSIAAGGSVTFGQSSGTVTMANGGAFDGDLIVTNNIRVNFTGTYTGDGQIKAETSGTLFSQLSGAVGGSIASSFMLNSTNISFTKGDVTAGTYAPGTFLTTIGGTTGGGLTLNGAITGDSDVDFSNNSAGGGGTGYVILNAASSYTGVTTINANTPNVATYSIKLGIDNALPTTTDVIVGTKSGVGAPVLDLNGYNQQIGSLSDGANVSGSKFLKITNEGTSDSTLTISGSTTPANSFSGVITDGATNKISVVKGGSNTLTLTGENTYQGATTIGGGTLALGGGGSINDSSGIAIAGGATFDVSAVSGYTLAQTLTAAGGGTANVTGAVGATGKTLDLQGAGSDALGILAFSDNLTLGSVSLKFNLGESNASDRITLGGTAAFSNTTIFLNALSTATSLSVGTHAYTLLTASGGLGSGLTLDSGSLQLTVNGVDYEITLELTAEAAYLNVTADGGPTTPIPNLAYTAPGSTISLHKDGTIGFAGTLANDGQGSLAVSLSSTGTLTVDNFSSTGATVGAGSSVDVSGLIHAGSTTGSFGWQVTNTDANGAPMTAAVGGTIVVYSGLGVWDSAGGGWNDPAKWTADGGVPGLDAGFTQTDTALFGDVLGGPATVTLDGVSPSLNQITFDSDAAYTLAAGTGSGKLVLDSATEAAVVDVLKGTGHTISADILMKADTIFMIENGFDLTVSGAIGATGGQTLTKAGLGTLFLTGANTYTGETFVNAGTLSIDYVLQGHVTVAGGASFLGAGAGSSNATFASGSSGTISGSSGTIENEGGDLAITTGGSVADYTQTGGTTTVDDGGSIGNLTQAGGSTTVGATGSTTGQVILNGGLFTVQGTAASTAGIAVNANAQMVVAGGGTVTGGGLITVTGLGSKLTVDGTVAADVNLGPGSLLKGSGVIEGDVTTHPDGGATISPANSVGTLTPGSLSLHGGDALVFEFKNAAGNTPGTDWDLIDLGGGLLDLGNADATNPIKIYIDALGSDGATHDDGTQGNIFDPLLSGQSWLFIRTTNPDSFAADPDVLDSLARRFVLYYNDGEFPIDEYPAGIGGVFGADNAYTRPVTSLGQGTFSVAFLGSGATRGLYITYSAIPEPGSMLLAGLASLGAGWYGRRRLKKTAEDVSAIDDESTEPNPNA